MSTGTKPTSVTTPQLATPEQPGRGRPSSQPIRRRRRSASHLTRSVRRRVQAASPASSPAAASPHVAARSPEQAPVETETALTPRAPPASASALTPEPPLTLAANHRSRRFLRVKKVETSRTGFAITYVCACQNRVEVRLYDSGYKWVSVEPLFSYVQKNLPQIETVEWTKEKIRIQCTCLCKAGCVFTCYPRQSRGCIQLQLLG